jgi:hypothetical protein
MTAKKSARKSVKLPDGRVAAGRGPAKGSPNAGRPPDEFRALMRSLVSREETVTRLEQILSGKVRYIDDEGREAFAFVDSDTFLKALQYATDRGYGKAQQHLDVTSNGESLTREQIAGMSVQQLRAEIAARLAAS